MEPTWSVTQVACDDVTIYTWYDSVASQAHLQTASWPSGYQSSFYYTESLRHSLVSYWCTTNNGERN